MTDRELDALPVELSSQLRYLDRKVRALAALRGVGVVCAVLFAGVAVGVLADWLLDLWVGFRTAILIGVLGAALLATVITFLRPLFRRTSSAELAALVDTSFPDLGERVESAVELADPELSEAHKGSAYMRSRLMRETIHHFSPASCSPSRSLSNHTKSPTVPAVSPKLYSIPRSPGARVMAVS